MGQKQNPQPISEHVAAAVGRLLVHGGDELQQLKSIIMSEHPSLFADEQGSVPAGVVDPSGVVSPPSTERLEPTANTVITPESNELQEGVLYGGSGIANEHDSKRKVLKMVATLVVILLLMSAVAGVWLLSSRDAQKQENRNTEKSVATVSTQQLQEVTNDITENINQVTVNGPLKINNNLIVNPSDRPDSAQAGQIYFDQTTKQFVYFDGVNFQTLATGGDVNQLNQIVNTGFLSIQGTGGAGVAPPSVSAGAGIALNGLQIINTGVLSLTGDGGIGVSASSGSVTISLPQSLDSGASPAFAGLTLGSPLNIASGGTGNTSYTGGGIIYYNGSSFVSSGAPASNGLCLVSSASGPVFSACSSGSAVTSLNGLSGVLSIANATGSGSTVTINDATTAAKGIASFDPANFTVAGGAVSIASDSIALGTQTTGNFVQSITAGAGLTGDAASEGAAASLAVGAGNGIIVNANDITLSLQAGKGLEVDGNGLSLIDCATGEVLKYNGSAQWACGTDSSGANTSLSNLSAVAINADLGVNTNNAYDLGSSANRFKDLYLGGSASIAGAINNLTLSSTALTATGAIAVVAGGANSDVTITKTGSGSIVFSGFDCSGQAAGGKLTVNALGQVVCADDSGGTMQSTYNASTSPEITLNATNGALTVRDNATPIGANLLEVQNNTGTVTYLGVDTGGIAVNGSIKLTGSGSFPASPVEGQIYYRTDTDQLYVYTGTKWQADRNTATKIIGMGIGAPTCTGTSPPVVSQNYEKADYVVTSCTSAQTEINAAIAALGTQGGVVYLLDGTFIADGQINLTSNVTLTGSGAGSVIKVKNSHNVDLSLISTDGASTRSRITLSNIKIDGNRTNNTAGNMYGITFNDIGAFTGIPGIKITNVWVENFRNEGMRAIHANVNGNSQVTNSYIRNNGGAGISLRANTNEFVIGDNVIEENGTEGIIVNQGSGAIITGNILNDNTGTGISLTTGSSDNVVTGNSIRDSGGSGVSLGLSATHNTISGNLIYSSASNGVSMGQTSDQNIISGNTIVDSGGHGVSVYGGENHVTGNLIENSASNSIDLTGTVGSSDESIVGNKIIDTGTGYAININSNYINTYIADNVITGTFNAAGSIRDAGVSTRYGGQMNGTNSIVLQGPGSVNIGQTSVGSGTLSVTGAYYGSQIATPSAPSASRVGTSGSTTYKYKITALDGVGETLPSVESTGVTNGNAVLDGTNFNRITWNRIAGATSYRIYRSTAGGTPNTTGLIGTVLASATTLQLDDTGLAASSAEPTINNTGGGRFAGDLAVNGTAITSTSATFNLLNSGVTTLNIGAAATSINIGAATGTLTINNAATQVKDLITTNVTANLFNTTATTLSIGGAATTLNIGADTGVTSVNNTLYVEDNIRLGVDGRTIADNGAGGSNATLTLNPGGSYVEITCNDPDGCDITLDEASPVAQGNTLHVVNMSVNPVNFTDAAGVSELAGNFAAGQWSALNLIYLSDRWVELSRSTN